MRRSQLALLAFLATSVSVVAQNSSTFAGCPTGTESLATGELGFNATKSAGFTLQPELGEWYISLGLRDSRADNLHFGDARAGQWLEVMLSVPESFIGSQQGNDTEYCMYRFPARNETADEDEEAGSCKGVISDDCVEAMQKSWMEDGNGCPSIDVREECGFNWEISTGTRANFTNATCALDSVPNIDLPDEYRTYTARTSSSQPSDEDVDEFEMYDLRTGQQFPFLVMARWSSPNAHQMMSKALCLAPDEIAEGSRQPESGASKLHGGSMLLVGLVTGVMVWKALPV